MRIADNKVSHQAPAVTRCFANITTPWWDGSEVYGDDAEKAKSLRDGASHSARQRLPADRRQRHHGHRLQRKLVARAQRACTRCSRASTIVICEALKRAYPAWDDERVYQTARLIVSALIAKIHTVEWTPAILATKTIEVGLRTNWYGAPKDWLDADRHHGCSTRIR